MGNEKYSARRGCRSSPFSVAVCPVELILIRKFTVKNDRLGTDLLLFADRRMKNRREYGRISQKWGCFIEKRMG